MPAGTMCSEAAGNYSIEKTGSLLQVTDYADYTDEAQLNFHSFAFRPFAWFRFSHSFEMQKATNYVVTFWFADREKRYIKPGRRFRFAVSSSRRKER
jgi:hypothetical protein